MSFPPPPPPFGGFPGAPPMPLGMPPMGPPSMRPPMPPFLGGSGGLPTIPNMRKPRALPPSEPNQTLYVRNLDERKNPKAVVRQLTSLFSQYGKIVSIRMNRTKRLRGQAFVVFSDREAAQKAMKQANGFPLFNRPMDVQYARLKSFSVAEQDGDLEQIREKRDAMRQKREEEERKKELESQKKAASLGSAIKPQAQMKQDEYLLPNHILFLQNLTEQVSSDLLTSLFAQFPGFKEVRTVPGRTDIAFVEYENDLQSAAAKQALHGYRVTPENEMKVSFAKK